jgi:hypothetical protein
VSGLRSPRQRRADLALLVVTLLVLAGLVVWASTAG